ncbi:MAG: hypothetical protein J2P46_17640 [Zavarzinella sp.]|nr:hypothetical protein [Zavarzinella sp.]
MNTKVFNLGLMAFWLLLCLGLLTRELWMPPALLEKVNSPQTPLAIAVAGLLAVWNLMRYMMARPSRPPTGPSPAVEQYRRKIRTISGDDPKVTDPQFRFDDPPPDAPR